MHFLSSILHTVYANTINVNHKTCKRYLGIQSIRSSVLNKRIEKGFFDQKILIL